MGRKGQVTVFIILGIVLMMIFAAVLLITNSTTKESFETQAAPVRESVPQEFTAIQQFVESCMFSVGKKGIKTIASQGGYIAPETLGEYSLSNPTDSQGINLNPLKVPYWHFNQNPNTDLAVSMASHKPVLYASEDSYNSVESQLARYIDENIQSCLNEFKVFEPQGFTVTSDYPESVARIQENQVVLVLEMPLEVQKESADTQMEQFTTTVPVNLPKLYSFASEITSAQQENKFLENQVLDLMLIHSGEDPTKLAPFNGVTLGSTVEWNDQVMETQIKEILSSYVPALKHSGANNFVNYEFSGEDPALTAISQRISDNMILPLGGEGQYDVRFSYLNWDPFFQVNGGEETIDTIDYSFDSPFDFLKFNVNFQQIYSVYDLSYPVLVTISDPTAFNGEGMDFHFALEANVRNNVAFDEESVQNPTVIAKKESLACDTDHRSTQEITTYLVDSFTFDPIDTVSVSFNLPGFDSCLIGTTDNIGKLAENYPSVYGGEIEFIHSDYLVRSLAADTYVFDDEPGIIGMAVAGMPNRVIEMHRKHPVDVVIKKQDLGKCAVPKVCNLDKDKCQEFAQRTCFFNSGAGLFLPDSPVYEFDVPESVTYKNEYYLSAGQKDLLDSEQASVILERVSDLDGVYDDEEFYAVLAQSGSTPSESIELVPGVYKMTAQLVSNTPKNIRADQRCSETRNENKCFELGGQEVDSFVTLTNWETEETYFTITPEDLYTSQTLTLTVLGTNIQSIPSTFESVDENDDPVEINALLIEDLQVMAESETISQMNSVRAQLEPSWS